MQGLENTSDGPTQRSIRVLVAESIPGTRQLLREGLQADPRLRVVGVVAQARAALDFLGQQRPDVVLMDNRLPDMDGYETTRRIMETHPLPIVLCAEAANADDTMFRSLAAGALACVEKPLVSVALPQRDATLAHLIQTVKLMSEVRVVRRWARAASVAPSVAPANALNPGARIVGIGASTGGPPALQKILAALPQDFPAPVLVVQHIARGFLPGMAEWLSHTSALNIQLGAPGVQPQAGSVYLAPDDFHMGVDVRGHIVLAREPSADRLRPSVAYLLHTLAEVYGASAIGVLLSGMGKDGARELKDLRDRGAATIAQDSASSVVHGMPGEAIALGAATHVMPAEKIAGMLMTLVQRRHRIERK
ncbi:MAG: chemotaxis protein CheB [Burkholderiaceae bacterium]